MKKIESIKILHTYDDNPDTSFMGEYTDQINDGIIIRKFNEFYEHLSEEQLEQIPDRSGEYRGFKPFNHIPHDPKNWDHVSKEMKKEVIKKYGSLKKADYSYALADYERMEQLNNGYFSFIGISAEAKVLTSYDGKNWLINTLSSGGLWGIESDSDSEYINEVQSEQLAELKDVLIEYGFTEQEINEKSSEVIYP